MAKVPFKLFFGQNGNATPYLDAGWSWPEPDRVWAIGANSVLKLPPMSLTGLVICELFVTPFIKSPYREIQRLEITINGEKVESFQIDRVRTVRFSFASNILSKTDNNDFSFGHPDHLRPDEVSDARDFRPLSLCFHHLALYEATTCFLSTSAASKTWKFSWGKQQGNSSPSAYLGCGWNDDNGSESSDLAFSGVQSDIQLPPLPTNTAGHITLKVHPYILAPYRSLQRLRVLLNDAEISRHDLSHPQILRIEIPAGLLQETQRNALVFEHPDFLIPHDIIGNADRRKVSITMDKIEIDLNLLDGFDPLLSIPSSELLRRFESLGQNCELGLVQRRVGAEPLGLFRWSSTHVASIIQALVNNFEELGEADNIVVELPQTETGSYREYMVREKKYGLYYHTWLYEGQVDPNVLKAREITKIKFLARKFKEDLSDGEKILVYKHDPALSADSVDALVSAVRRHGNNPILLVEITATPEKVGDVEALGGGLFRGYLDRFAPPENAYDLSFDAWIKMCRKLSILTDKTFTKPDFNAV